METVGTPAWDWLWSAQDWGKTERQWDVSSWILDNGNKPQEAMYYSDFQYIRLIYYNVYVYNLNWTQLTQSKWRTIYW